MKDFFKIFAGLSIVIIVFMFGRNYGEDKLRSSEEFQALIKKETLSDFNNNNLSNIRIKFQNIIDSEETKKAADVRAQILQILMDDLGLAIKNPQKFLNPSPEKASIIVVSSTGAKTAAAAPKNFSSYEQLLTNSANTAEVRKNLKNLEIKDLDQFLTAAKPAEAKQLELLFGSFRGRVFDVNRNEYATLVIEVLPTQKNEKKTIDGRIKMFKGGHEVMGSNFSAERPGYTIQNSLGLIIDQENRYFQVYKINETRQLAGFFYERLPGGTTKTIGNFVVNRVDQF